MHAGMEARIQRRTLPAVGCAVLLGYCCFVLLGIPGYEILKLRRRSKLINHAIDAVAALVFGE